MAVETKKPSLGTQTGNIIATADDETLFGLIRDKALGIGEDVWGGDPMLRAVLSLAEHEGWTVQHTALAVAYTFIMKNKYNMELILDMVSKSARPIVMHMHCKTCTCTDKSVNYEDL